MTSNTTEEENVKELAGQITSILDGHSVECSVRALCEAGIKLCDRANIGGESFHKFAKHYYKSLSIVCAAPDGWSEKLIFSDSE